ncbi:MAG: histidine--tRNA ligase [Methyloceanibacter sp.]|uniref:histidine--tRNA ligase n=1 Tax=Methyloceanibacter sp. TaxID=1965321 RepID=UPI003D9AF437
MNDKTPDRPEARLPKGLQDISAGEIRAREKSLATIRQVFESYGFEPFDTPAIEYSDALGKFLPDQDRPNEGVFSFQDDDEQWLSLRYDLTAPLARYVAQNTQLGKPFRRYQVGPVWRNEKPGPGRFRQFMQFDADTVGASSLAADAELCMLAADTLEALGINRGDYVVKVNSRKVLDGVLDKCGATNAEQRLAVLRAIDKLDRLGEAGVRALLGKGRKDESGDFTKGAQLSPTQIELIMKCFKDYLASDESWSLADLKDVEGFGEKPLRSIQALASSKYDDELKRPQYEGRYFDNLSILEDFETAIGVSSAGHEGIAELREIIALTSEAGYGSLRIRVDPSVVRGLEYYTGPVFEAELTAPTKDKRGQLVRLGSVVSGGRYDGLVERFTGEKVPATGISIGVSRLLFGLQLLGKYEESATQGPVVVLVLDRARIADYQKMAQDLRNAGIRAELYLGDSDKMGVQIKYADRRGSPCAVIQGGDEFAKGEVTIKDLILGVNLSAIKDRDEYLKKQAEAQFSRPADQLVEAVKGVLARHQA